MMIVTALLLFFDWCKYTTAQQKILTFYDEWLFFYAEWQQQHIKM
jgi:hypothetical protein